MKGPCDDVRMGLFLKKPSLTICNEHKGHFSLEAAQMEEAALL